MCQKYLVTKPTVASINIGVVRDTSPSVTRFIEICSYPENESGRQGLRGMVLLEKGTNIQKAHYQTFFQQKLV